MYVTAETIVKARFDFYQLYLVFMYNFSDGFTNQLQLKRHCQKSKETVTFV